MGQETKCLRSQIVSSLDSSGSIVRTELRLECNVSKAAAELARVEEQEVVDGGAKLNSSTSSHSWSGNRRFAIQLGYSQAGLLESETYLGGTLDNVIVQMAADGYLRPQTLGVSNAGTPLGSLVTYGYDGASRVSSVTEGAFNMSDVYENKANRVRTVILKQNTTLRVTSDHRYDLLGCLRSLTSTLNGSTTPPKALHLKAAVLLLICLVLLSSPMPLKAAIDRNGNGMSDIWELTYGASALPPSVDTDGDGYSNLQESQAGTDPFNRDSFPRLTILLISPDSLEISWDTVAGKWYSLQSRPSITQPWTNSSPVLGSAGTQHTNIPLGSAVQFFRLKIDDADSDGDGVTDYEELALGFNPFSTHTARNDLLDTQRITNSLSTQSLVTISALDPMMFERWPDPGLVAVRRSGGLAPIDVTFVLGGTATAGADFTSSATNSIRIPAGKREVWLELSPIPDSDDAESTETISVTLMPGSGYSIGASNIAHLTLVNDTESSPPHAKSAARFLIQAAYGPDLAPSNGLPPNLSEVMSLGFEGWIEDQFSRPIGYLQPWVDWAVPVANGLQLYGNLKEYSWWSRAMGSPKLRPDSPTTQLPDPLRQRIAFALSEILVTSDRPEALAVEQRGMANYYDLMLKHAFGNYRDLLYEVAMHPAMGIYLSHLGNQKAVPGSNMFPDENFAREIMQLFSIGLWQLNPDGTRVLGPDNQPIATYNNSHITELARVFTGISFGNNTLFNLWPRDFTVPMKCWDDFHDCNAKTLLSGLQLPARAPSPGNQGLAGLADIDAAVSNLWAHPNVGPFIGRQLIQRLVTSNPSTGYVARVSSAFSDNGNGVRGEMKSVIKAILLDPEARDPQMMNHPTWGKLREPLLRVVNFARAFNAASVSGYYPLDQFTLDHGEDPMNAPSVFNFFLPGHSPPGPLTQMGLVAPEFQIINASTAITGPNYFWDDAILGGLHTQGAGNPNYAVRPNLTNELGLIVPLAQIGQDVPAGPAADPDALIRRLDIALTGGSLSPPQFEIIREAMLRVSTNTWQWHRERLRLAIYLIVTSSDFNVLR